MGRLLDPDHYPKDDLAGTRWDHYRERWLLISLLMSQLEVERCQDRPAAAVSTRHPGSGDGGNVLSRTDRVEHPLLRRSWT